MKIIDKIFLTFEVLTVLITSTVYIILTLPGFIIGYIISSIKAGYFIGVYCNEKNGRLFK